MAHHAAGQFQGLVALIRFRRFQRAVKHFARHIRSGGLTKFGDQLPAIGAPGIPPNPVLIGLALFLTFFVMQPVFEASFNQGIMPMTEGRISELAGLEAAAQPFRLFMVANIREDDLLLFLDLGGIQAVADPAQTPWRALIPAFIVGELKRAFEIGFLLFLPFLIIDMVIASLLMSLGMMMLPPSVVALPFKLIFFVLVDGWRLVSGSLVQGFNLN